MFFVTKTFYANKIYLKNLMRTILIFVKFCLDIQMVKKVSKEDFLKMLENNFYSKKVDKCILYEEERISKLPQYFNLYIERITTITLKQFYLY